MEAHAPKRYSGVSDTTQKGETKMKQETKARIRVVGRILFLVYLLALVYFLFFAEEYGRRNFFELDYRYNLVPFQEIRRFWIYREKVGFLAAFLNLAGNVIGFLPFGFIVPVMHKKMESFWKVSLLGFLFSLCVETIQLITKVGSEKNASVSAERKRYDRSQQKQKDRSSLYGRCFGLSVSAGFGRIVCIPRKRRHFSRSSGTVLIPSVGIRLLCGNEEL